MWLDFSILSFSPNTKINFQPHVFFKILSPEALPLFSANNQHTLDQMFLRSCSNFSKFIKKLLRPAISTFSTNTIARMNAEAPLKRVSVKHSLPRFPRFRENGVARGKTCSDFRIAVSRRSNISPRFRSSLTLLKHRSRNTFPISIWIPLFRRTGSARPSLAVDRLTCSHTRAHSPRHVAFLSFLDRGCHRHGISRCYGRREPPTTLISFMERGYLNSNDHCRWRSKGGRASIGRSGMMEGEEKLTAIGGTRCFDN